LPATSTSKFLFRAHRLAPAVLTDITSGAEPLRIGSTKEKASPALISMIEIL
jgi:hypothetical protein